MSSSDEYRPAPSADVRRDRYIEVASTKTDKAVKFSYKLTAAF